MVSTIAIEVTFDITVCRSVVKTIMGMVSRNTADCCRVISSSSNHSSLFKHGITAQAEHIARIACAAAAWGKTVANLRSANMIGSIFCDLTASLYHFATAETVGIAGIPCLAAICDNTVLNLHFPDMVGSIYFGLTSSLYHLATAIAVGISRIAC